MLSPRARRLLAVALALIAIAAMFLHRTGLRLHH
jgi:hypothetical protein